MSYFTPEQLLTLTQVAEILGGNATEQKHDQSEIVHGVTLWFELDGQILRFFVRLEKDKFAISFTGPKIKIPADNTSGEKETNYWDYFRYNDEGRERDQVITSINVSSDKSAKAIANDLKRRFSHLPEWNSLLTQRMQEHRTHILEQIKLGNEFSTLLNVESRGDVERPNVSKYFSNSGVKIEVDIISQDSVDLKLDRITPDQAKRIITLMQE